MRKIGLPAQAGCMIARPSRLFERIREKPLVLLPVLIAIVGGVFNGLFSVKSLEGMDISSMPQQAQAVMQAMQGGSMNALYLALGVLGGVAALFFNAFVVWLLLRIFRVKGGYMQAVSVFGVGAYPFMIRDILRYFLAAPADMNLGALAQTAQAATYGSELLRLLGATGIVFLVWAVLLMTRGFSRVCGAKAGRVAAVLFLFFAAGLLAGALIQYLGQQAVAGTPSIMGG